jgi:hypothetical protein
MTSRFLVRSLGAVIGILLLSPATAHADGPGNGWIDYANELTVGSWDYDSFDNNGTESDEPVTPGSGSVCNDLEGSWDLGGTSWFFFTGTGGRMIARLDGWGNYAMVLYETEGRPTVDDGLGCVRSTEPRRFEFDTVAGRRYMVQVGDWERDEDIIYGENDFRVSLGIPTSHDEPENALALPLMGATEVHNFGATMSNELPQCLYQGSDYSYPYSGARSVWMAIDVPEPGVLALDLVPRDADSWAYGILSLYPPAAGRPSICRVDNFDPTNLGTELSTPVGPGRHLIQLMTESDGGDDEASEENWTMNTRFVPNLDVDGDGHARPSDCRDDLGAVHPGAVEVIENGVDDNCDGRDDRSDLDRDGVPDYLDRCPRRPSRGIDTNRDGCRDPRQLPLTALVQLSVRRGALHVAGLSVRSAPGANVTLSCDKRACRRERRIARGKSLRMGRLIVSPVPEGTRLTLTATKKGRIGMVKRYRLKSTGVRLIGQWCLKPGSRTKRTRCG